MRSIKNIYKTGRGPSSSHTMGPVFAAKRFREEHPTADRMEVILYGSLAKTGEGHGTDRALRETFAPIPTHIRFVTDDIPLPHPNTMDLIAYRGDSSIARARVLSIGGGEIRFEGDPPAPAVEEVYPENDFSSIAQKCKKEGIRLSDYVFAHEDKDFPAFLGDVWQTMSAAIREGLTHTGTLPGGLSVERKAQYLFNQRHIDESPQTRENRIVCAYAFAVSEQNADCGLIVTAPTCGACGVVPAVLKYMQEKSGFTDNDVIRALAAAGLVGAIVARNASISGAECGCQAEVGTACSMAATALAELYGMGIDQIEYAAEMSMEHMLGLTCDPIGGLVQIPCIERNAYAAARAFDAGIYALYTDGQHRVSFDQAVKVMKKTGHDLPSLYKETSEGGLAKVWK